MPTMKWHFPDTACVNSVVLKLARISSLLVLMTASVLPVWSLLLQPFVQDGVLMGKMAVYDLIAKLEGREVLSRRRVLVSLCVRESCGCQEKIPANPQNTSL